jgi:succinate dehydrogenase / fumarate reductase cytochrome b subunit
MCVETSIKSGGGNNSCGCGGHGHQSRAAAARPDPRAILALKFGAEAEHQCNCSGHTCPRRYLAWSGFALGGFLLLHLALNSLVWWPARFQAAVNHIHGLGAALPVLEIGLIFIPLTIHVALGLRTLGREKLRFGVEKHHHGSDLRQWLQRLTALILLVFIAFHVVTLHRWFGGRFDSHDALGSAARAIRQFWRGLPAGHPGNLLFAQFYLLGIAAAVYHLANGIATGAEVLGWVSTPGSQQRLWRISVIASSALLLAGLAAWLALTRKAFF